MKSREKSNLYSPVIRQEEYLQNESKTVLEKLYGNSIKKFVASLYQGNQIAEEDLDELNDFIKRTGKSQRLEKDRGKKTRGG